MAGRSYIQKPKGVLTISNVRAEHQGVYTCLINKLRQGKYVGIASTKKFMLGIIGLKDNGDGMKVVDPAQMVTIPPQRMSTLKLTMVTSVKSVGGGDGGESGGKGYLQVTKVRANIFTLQFHAYIFHCKQVQDGSSGRVTQ